MEIVTSSAVFYGLMVIGGVLSAVGVIFVVKGLSSPNDEQAVSPVLDLKEFQPFESSSQESQLKMPDTSLGQQTQEHKIFKDFQAEMEKNVEQARIERPIL